MIEISSLLTTLGIVFSKVVGKNVDTYFFVDYHGQQVYLRQFGDHFTLFHDKGDDCQVVTFKTNYNPTFEELMVTAFDQKRLQMCNWTVM